MTVSGSSRGHTGEDMSVETEAQRLNDSGQDVLRLSSSPFEATTPCSEDEPERAAETPLLKTQDVHLEAEPEVTQETEEEEDDGVPYDRGWAWVVVFGQLLSLRLCVCLCLSIALT